MKARKMLCLVVFTAVTLAATAALAAMPQYVFFFLGDGMANAQIQATKAYLTTKNGGSATLATDLRKPANRLNLSKLPVLGMQTTYNAQALITDSAAAGTAFACGVKTKSGVVGMDETQTIRYKSIAQLAAESGKRVGILSSVSLDHATPASYYASVANRGYLNNIATQMVAAEYDFYGGGGLASPTGPARSGDTGNNIWNLLAAKGYTVLNDRASILSLNEKPKNKVFCINPWLQDAAAMPYAIDRPATNLSLAEMTGVAINALVRAPKDHKLGPARDQGFFLMVEGGKIDWACHANDAMAAIGDTLDFDEAIGVALDFYRKHPHQTLIVVTSDHETGGMTVGHATTGYSAHYDRLLKQTHSFTSFGRNQWSVHKAAHSSGYVHTSTDNLASNAAMIDLMESSFGLKWAELNSLQQEKLEDAYDKSMCGQNKNSVDANNLLYGGQEPIIVTLTHILNERAGIGWTSYSHTGVPVPVYAIGSESRGFSGFYDNTDIAKQMAKAMGIWQRLPIEK